MVHSVKHIAEGAMSGRTALNIVSNTTGSVPMVAPAGNLAGLVANTTGAAAAKIPVTGVLTKTTAGADMKTARTLQKNEEPRSKTQPASYGQVPYAGRKY